MQSYVNHLKNKLINTPESSVARSASDANVSPVATADANVSCQWTDILPSPEFSRKSRRRRRVQENIDLTTLGCSRSDSKVSLDHVTKKSVTFSHDEVPLDLLSSRSEVPLDR